MNACWRCRGKSENCDHFEYDENDVAVSVAFYLVFVVVLVAVVLAIFTGRSLELELLKWFT